MKIKLSMEIPNRPTFNKQISRNALEGTPSSSSSKRTRFKATISMVSLFFPGKEIFVFYFSMLICLKTTFIIILTTIYL
jgi:hypothetical protein